MYTTRVELLFFTLLFLFLYFCLSIFFSLYFPSNFTRTKYSKKNSLGTKLTYIVTKKDVLYDIIHRGSMIPYNKVLSVIPLREKR